MIYKATTPPGYVARARRFRAVSRQRSLQYVAAFPEILAAVILRVIGIGSQHTLHASVPTCGSPLNARGSSALSSPRARAASPPMIGSVSAQWSSRSISRARATGTRTVAIGRTLIAPRHRAEERFLRFQHNATLFVYLREVFAHFGTRLFE